MQGDGRIALVEWSCAEKTWVWYALEETELTEVERKTEEAPGAQDFKMEDGSYACPACPIVYAGGSNTQPVGEILRNLATPQRKGWQRLHLPLSAAQTNGSVAVVEVKLAEEKPEVTYVDALRLVIGNDTYAPLSCKGTPAAWCLADGSTLKLQPGQARSFAFEVPAEAVRGGLWLEALGHYEPILTLGASPADAP